MARKNPEPIIGAYGEYWPRNPENLEKIASRQNRRLGLYILYNATIPVYVGIGKIWERLREHTEGRKSDYWEYFSWYEVRHQEHRRELETLLVRALPVYCHLLNNNRPRFANKKERRVSPASKAPVKVKRPRYGTGSKFAKRRNSG